MVTLNRAQALTLWKLAMDRSVAETVFELLPTNNFGEVTVVATLDSRPWATWKLKPTGGYESIEEAKYENKEVPEEEV